ncbi:hypothetical protein OIU76_020757 [Salix suchowensis]|nr:hypothetical protein OIU76_020757 [Salix suchowensis]
MCLTKGQFTSHPFSSAPEDINTNQPHSRQQLLPFTASLRVSGMVVSGSSSSRCSHKRLVTTAINGPKIRFSPLSLPKLSTNDFIEELSVRSGTYRVPITTQMEKASGPKTHGSDPVVVAELMKSEFLDGIQGWQSSQEIQRPLSNPLCCRIRKQRGQALQLCSGPLALPFLVFVFLFPEIWVLTGFLVLWF